MKVFLGSSQEAVRRGTMSEIAVWIERLSHEPVPWNKPGLFLAGSYVFHRLVEISKEVDAALFIFAEDDQVWYRGDLTTQPRDNVLIEYGLFAGALGMDRAILCREGKPRTPSDLAGIIYLDVTENKRNQAELEMRAWLNSLAKPSRMDALISTTQDRRPEDDLWPPLLEAARELERRLVDLSRVYRRQWTDPFTPESLSGDFCELYMLSRDPIENFQECDPNERRKDLNAVQKIRTRMVHELNYAVTSLYIIAKYLGWAEHVQRDLKEDRLILRGDARDEILRLFSNVRGSLQGNAGILVEQQDSIAEMVWAPAGRVITNLEFQKRLLELPG
jgi:hypothetical protein